MENVLATKNIMSVSLERRGNMNRIRGGDD